MPWPWRLRILGLPMLLPVLLWQAPRPVVGQFDMLAADVGQGNAVIIRTAKHTLVYDAGPRFSLESDAGNRVLVPLLRSTKEVVDTVMLSHRDIDHSGGIKSLLTAYPQATFMSSIDGTHELQGVRPAIRCLAGQQWEWDDVTFTVLHPRVQDYETPQKSNAMSCVLRISSKQGVPIQGQGMVEAKKVLLTGDIEQAQEAILIAEHAEKQSAMLQTDVLLAPHHGSKTSSSEAFLDAVKPSMAVFQMGYRNRFGHPAAAVLERYQARNIKTIDSAHCGAFRWQSAQPDDFSCYRQQVMRYWQHQVP